MADQVGHGDGVEAARHLDPPQPVRVPERLQSRQEVDLPHHRRRDLRDRTDRRRLYENLLAEGDQHMIMRWVDGALLVDVWSELVLPEKIRAAWEPAVEAASSGRVRGVFSYDA